MTTQESNELIAGFLKLEKAGPGFHAGYFYKEEFYQFDELEFHSSWDWLMSCIKKIQMDWEGLPEVFFGHLDLGSPIEQVYDAVVEFLK